MRKALKKVTFLISTILILATLLTISVVSSSASSTSTKDYIFEYLTQELGLNSAAACGIMANIESESKFSSTSVIVDTNGLLSGGLCQWNGSRFSKLISYCDSIGLDYLSVEGQLRYLQYELENGYSGIYSYLKSVPDTADGAYAAAYYWCYYFEIPADRSSKSVARGNTAKYSYWETYGEKVVSTPDLSLNGDVFDVGTNVAFTFSSVESYVDEYNLYIASANEDCSYNWDEAIVYTKSEASTIKINTLSVGDYACYMQAVNSSNNISSDDFEILYFSVECQTHEFLSTVVQEATLSSNGLREYCCQTCDETYTKIILKLELEDLAIEIEDEIIKISSIQTLEVTESYTANTISTTVDSAELTTVDLIYPTTQQEKGSRKTKADKPIKYKVASL